MKRDLALAFSAFALLFILAFFLSIIQELGEAESLHDPSSLLLYGRRILMVVLALTIPWFTRKEPPQALGWGLSVKWIAISIAVGVFMGFSLYHKSFR